MSVEREVKFEILDKRSFERLREGLLALTSEPVEQLYHPNHYFDTADLRIARSHGMLRIRTGADERIMTYKRGATFEEGVLESEELETPLEDAVVDRVLKKPAELLELDNRVARQVREDLGAVKLEYLGFLETSREVFAIEGWRLELDRMYIGRKKYHELEIEAEDVAGAAKWAAQLLDELEVKWEPSRRTKLDRLLEHLGRG